MLGVAWSTPRYDKVVDKDSLPLRLERHKRLFFASGQENTKLQASFKIPIIYESKLYLAYTETGFWELYQKRSSPFLDINHNLEIFYRFNIGEETILDLGLEHISNGRNEEASRSWNDVYVQALMRFSDNFYVTTKVWQLFDIDATNEDIYKYLGFFEVELGFQNVNWKRFQQNEIFLKIRPGGRLDPSDGYYTFDAGVRFKFDAFKGFPHFFISYYNGYAENQIQYNRYIRAIRFGLTF